MNKRIPMSIHAGIGVANAPNAVFEEVFIK